MLGEAEGHDAGDHGAPVAALGDCRGKVSALELGLLVIWRARRRAGAKEPYLS